MRDHSYLLPDIGVKIFQHKTKSSIISNCSASIHPCNLKENLWGLATLHSQTKQCVGNHIYEKKITLTSSDQK